MANNSSSCFITVPGFCPDCGSVLPLLDEKGRVRCYTCKREWNSEGVFRISFSVKRIEIRKYIQIPLKIFGKMSLIWLN